MSFINIWSQAHLDVLQIRLLLKRLFPNFKQFPKMDSISKFKTPFVIKQDNTLTIAMCVFLRRWREGTLDHVKHMLTCHVARLIMLSTC